MIEYGAVDAMVERSNRSKAAKNRFTLIPVVVLKRTPLFSLFHKQTAQGTTGRRKAKTCGGAGKTPGAMNLKLTPKQETFCQKYIETGNASAAYLAAYNTANMKPETVNRNAFALLEKSKIAARIQELQAALQKKFEINIDVITKMYLHDRKLAHQLGNPSAAVSATTGLARLYGLDKQVHHVRNDPIQELLDEIAGTSLGPPSERKKH